MSRPPASGDVFRAVADPTRRGLLDLLAAEDLPVNDLARSFDMTLPAVSQHLRILREVGLVRERREGRQRFYHLRADPLREMAAWVGQYERFWRRKLQALGAHLERNP
ncbi:MAG: helix-turn-helix transcriptional regulator [Acidobacteria bacterium]|nr:helix-turn-helix transcriptional regulator [Acidobacteriota bacterium]